MLTSWLWDSGLIQEVWGRDHRSGHSTEYQPHLPVPHTRKDKVSLWPTHKDERMGDEAEAAAQAGLIPQG